jgi:hypothetical protein
MLATLLPACRIAHLFGTPNPRGFTDWGNLKRAVRVSGSHFFDPETMRAFGSRTLGEPKWIAVDGKPCVMFITSERDRYGGAWEGARRYTIRHFDPMTGRIYSGGFGEYPTARAVRAAFRKVPTL